MYGQDSIPLDQQLADEVKRLEQEDRKLNNENICLKYSNDGEEQRQRAFEELKRKRDELVRSIQNKKARKESLLSTKAVLVAKSKAMTAEFQQAREAQDKEEEANGDQSKERKVGAVVVVEEEQDSDTE
jgi:predicted transcriptional regulator